MKSEPRDEHEIPTISKDFKEIVEILKQPPAGCTPPFAIAEIKNYPRVRDCKAEEHFTDAKRCWS